MNTDERRSKWRKIAKRYRDRNREKVRERNRNRYHTLLKHDEGYKQHRTEYGKIYRENQLELNPEKVKENWRKHQQNRRDSGSDKETRKRDYIKNRLTHLVNSAKARAKKFNLPFNITKDDFVIPEVCPVLGIPITFESSKKKVNQNAPSLDRIIPELGYVKNNVIVISWRANRLKWNASLDELEKLSEFYNQYK